MKTFTDPELFSRVVRLPLCVFTVTGRPRDEDVSRLRLAAERVGAMLAKGR